MNKIIWIGRLRIEVGNEDAPTGKRIPWYLIVIWHTRRPRNVVLFSNYSGG
jgi:hypothetical protein